MNLLEEDANVSSPLLSSESFSTGNTFDRGDGSQFGTYRDGSSSARLRAESLPFVRANWTDSPQTQKMGWSALCFLTFFNVCGGPIGSEEVFSSAGPFVGIVGIFVFVLFWAIPMILVTAELSSVYPNDGGYSIWTAEAFGPFMGWAVCAASACSGIIDTAIYPVMAYDTTMKLLKIAPLSFVESYVTKLILVVLFAVPNLFMNTDFGRWMTGLAVFVVLPFVVSCVYLLVTRSSDMDPSQLLRVDSSASSEDWANLISVLYWNFSGFDAASTCAGEVRDPARSYPRGLAAALVLIIVTYLLPLSVFGMINEPKWSTWEEGSLSLITETQVGSWMGIWVMVSGFAANMGMYAAEIFEDSWQLYGMACKGLMPSPLASRYGEDGPPYVAVLFALAGISAIILLDFNSIVVITNFYSCLTALIELMAFLKLRVTEPDLKRPFKVPIDNVSLLALWMVLPMSIGAFILASSLFASSLSVIINTGVLILGVLLYQFMDAKGHIQYN